MTNSGEQSFIPTHIPYYCALRTDPVIVSSCRTADEWGLSELSDQRLMQHLTGDNISIYRLIVLKSKGLLIKF